MQYCMYLESALYNLLIKKSIVKFTAKSKSNAFGLG